MTIVRSDRWQKRAAGKQLAVGIVAASVLLLGASDLSAYPCRGPYGEPCGGPRSGWPGAVACPDCEKLGGFTCPSCSSVGQSSSADWSSGRHQGLLRLDVRQHDAANVRVDAWNIGYRGCAARGWS
jgi:hypothetical protein